MMEPETWIAHDIALYIYDGDQIQAMQYGQ